MKIDYEIDYVKYFEARFEELEIHVHKIEVDVFKSVNEQLFNT